MSKKILNDHLTVEIYFSVFNIVSQLSEKQQNKHTISHQFTNILVIHESLTIQSNMNHTNEQVPSALL